MIRLVPTNRKIDLEGVTLAWIVSVTLFFCAILALYFFNQRYGTQLTPCPFKFVTSTPCFLCGGTRASMSLISGNVSRAFSFNPLVTFALLLIFTRIILKFAFGRKIKRTGFLADRRALWLIVIVAVTSNWIYVIRTLS